MNLINSVFVPQESVNDQFLTLVSLYVKTGDFVKADTLVAELETSKALIEVKSEVDGFIKIYVESGTDLKVGTLMFELYDSNIELSTQESTEFIEFKDSPILSTSNSAVFSKAALNYISQNNINVDELSKSNKFITTKDLIKNELKCSAAPLSPKFVEETSEVNRTNKNIKPISKFKKVEFEYLHSINSSSVISRLAVSIKVSKIDLIADSQHFIKSTPLPSIIYEVSRLLIKYPNLNSFYLNGDQAFYNEVNIGFAIDDGLNGLKVASIKSTDNLNLSQIEESISDFTLKYAKNQLSSIDLTSATFTISDLFNTSVVGFHPLVNNNNSCIMGISSLLNSQFVIDLSFDHRITSGKEVADFLNDLKYRLESRFNKSNVLNDNILEDIKCEKCLISSMENDNKDIYFHKVINKKINGYICSYCLMSW